MLADYPIADSIIAGGNAVGPVGNADIVTAGAPPKGLYEIRFSASVGAGALAADNGNIKLAYNGAAQILAVTTNGAVHKIPRIQLDGSGQVKLQTVGAATAGAVYTGTLVVTRIN